MSIDLGGKKNFLLSREGKMRRGERKSGGNFCSVGGPENENSDLLRRKRRRNRARLIRVVFRDGGEERWFEVA